MFGLLHSRSSPIFHLQRLSLFSSLNLRTEVKIPVLEHRESNEKIIQSSWFLDTNYINDTSNGSGNLFGSFEESYSLR